MAGSGISKNGQKNLERKLGFVQTVQYKPMLFWKVKEVT